MELIRLYATTRPGVRSSFDPFKGDFNGAAIATEKVGFVSQNVSWDRPRSQVSKSNRHHIDPVPRKPNWKRTKIPSERAYQGWMSAAILWTSRPMFAEVGRRRVKTCLPQRPANTYPTLRAVSAAAIERLIAAAFRFSPVPLLAQPTIGASGNQAGAVAVSHCHRYAAGHGHRYFLCDRGASLALALRPPLPWPSDSVFIAVSAFCNRDYFRRDGSRRACT
jgi:hypothetical protein